MVHHPAIPRTRRLVENTVLFLTALVILHTWFIEGFPVSCRVEGGSMAPALLGSHVDWTCPNCHFAFACDAEGAGEAAFVVCPNCGTRFTPDKPPAILSGDRVLIDRSAFQFRRPRRWEVVAFERSVEDAGLVVKRVVGLPDETIRIQNGDLWIHRPDQPEGYFEIVRKDLRQQRAMRILVHDDDRCGATPRWRPEDLGSNWTRHEGRLVHTESPDDEIGWIVYNHAAPGGNTDQSAPITDYGYYNRGRMQRNEDIHPTPDVAMAFRLQDLHGRGMIWLRATDGRDEFMVQINPRTEKFTVVKNRKPLTDGSGSLPSPLRGETLEVSLIDRQFLLAVGSKTLFTAAIETPRPGVPGAPPPVSNQPLAIGVQGLGAALDRLRVYRDIYYNVPPGTAREKAESVQVRPDEYFVLGDNSPISEDSRTWAEDRLIRPKSFAGKPFVVIYPACGFSLGGWHIQVPDLTRIRYIR